MRTTRKKPLWFPAAVLAAFLALASSPAFATTSDTYTIVLTGIDAKLTLLEQGPLTHSMTVGCFTDSSRSDGQTIPVLIEYIDGAGTTKYQTAMIALTPDGQKRYVFQYVTKLWPSGANCDITVIVTTTTCGDTTAWRIEFKGFCAPGA